jgi:hypothetical protein
MSISTARAPCHVAYVTSPIDFGSIHQPAINFVVWRRALRVAVARFGARACGAATALAMDGEASAPNALAFLRRGLGQLGEDRDSEFFLQDASAMISAFAIAEPADHYRIRLERVVGDSCRLFHADHIRSRLICTYHGPGTEWLTNEDVRREALGGEGSSAEDINRRIVREGARVRRLRTGWIGIMKGDAYPMNEARGLVHRSVPIVGTGNVRLRLAVEACRHASGR